MFPPAIPMDDYSVEINVRDAWRRVGSRTILYYAYLLTKPLSANIQKANIRHDLQEMITLQLESFDDIIIRFTRQNIMTSPAKCALTLVAMGIVENLILTSMGSTDPVPFDGVEIYKASKGKRWDMWVKDGSTLLKQLFSKVKGIKIQSSDQPFRRGSLITFETTLEEPVLMVWFVNTPRIHRISEVYFLADKVNGVINERRRRIRNGEKGSEYSLMVVDIVAAPTYDLQPTRDALNGSQSRRFTGPINLAIIAHYLSQNISQVEKNYFALLSYLDPSGPETGVILSDRAIEYMQRYKFYT